MKRTGTDPIVLLAFLAILKWNLLEHPCLVDLYFLTILSVKLEIGGKENLNMAWRVVSFSKAFGVGPSSLEEADSVLTGTDHDVIRAWSQRYVRAMALVAFVFAHVPIYFNSWDCPVRT